MKSIHSFKESGVNMNGSVYVFIILIAGLILWRRTRSFYRPIRGSGIRLLLPVLFMLPGIMIFLNPRIHAPLLEWIIAIVIGLALSIPLIWTTNYEVREDQQIYAKKNMGFIVAFLAILGIRLLLRNYVSMLDPETLAALFMVIAFSYVIPWRVMSYLKFRKLARGRLVA